MPGAGAVQASKKRQASDVSAARAAKAARRASALSSDTTNISAASPDSGRNSPTDIRLLFTIAAESARCRTRSEEHTSELQSLMRISYAVFCLKKKKKLKSPNTNKTHQHNVITENKNAKSQ